MDLAAAWLLYPAAALLVAGGHGLLVERLSGSRVSGLLLLPLGVASIVACTQLTTYSHVTAKATIPLMLAVAVAGYAAGAGRLRTMRVDPLQLLAVLGVFVVFAAPTVLWSNNPSFAGYNILGDTAVHLIGADQLLKTGRDFDSLPPSTYKDTLVEYFNTAGYPSGGSTAAGALTPLSGLDVSQTFQSFLALLAVMLALCVIALVRTLLPGRGWAALAGFAAAQSTLVLAYALQGSVKELGAAFAVALMAATAGRAGLDTESGPLRVVPFAVACAAAIGFVGLAAGVWIAPFSVALIAATVASRPVRWRRELPAGGVLFAVLLAGLGYQALAGARQYSHVAKGVVTTLQERGNLFTALDPLQMFGVWFNGDYRLPPDDVVGTYLLIGLALAGAVAGLLFAIRRRGFTLLTYSVVSFLAWAYVTSNGSLWARGKALVIISPAAVMLVIVGAAALAAAARRIEGIMLATAVLVGIVVSNAMAFHQVSVAPGDRYKELAGIAEKIGGHGPTLTTEFDEYAKHFLRAAQPVNGSAGIFSADVDDQRWKALRSFRTIVQRRGPLASRPPSAYRSVHRGRWYEVWERSDAAAARIIDHYGIGHAELRAAAGLPRCKRVRKLAHEANAAGGALRFVARRADATYFPDRGTISPKWRADNDDAGVLELNETGAATGTMRAPSGGLVDVWLEGSFGRRMTVLLDGRPIGSAAYQLNGRRAAELIATMRLTAGRHTIRVVSDGGGLHAGNGGSSRLLGPVSFTPHDAADAHWRTLPPAKWHTLCGRSLDWVEAVRP